MRAILIFLLAWLATAQACAQTEPTAPVVAGPPAYDEQDVAREHARIAAERKAAADRFAREEADCYQRFAVNDCLRTVRRSRRAVLEELRSQEIRLKDMERQHLAAEQERKAAEREAERKSEAEQREREAASKAYQERAQSALKRQQDRAKEREQRAADAPTGGAEPRKPTPTAAGPATQSEADANRKIYEAKQREARERQQALEKEKARRAGEKSRSLPVPP